jgi:hypothetical protein
MGIMNRRVLLLVLAALPPLLGACVMLGSPVGPGSEPGKIPPRLERSKDNKGLRWSNPAAFGPVPTELQSKGDAVCQFNRFERATGYHADARELDGTVIQGGGYFCVGTVNELSPGGEPGKVPPRLVRSGESGLMWDNPAAFGPVPPEFEARGYGVCRDAGFERATGYHPQARELDGTIIKGGGYFCVGAVK